MSDETTHTQPVDTVYRYFVDAAEARATGQIDWFTCAYVTDGGTWMLATSPEASTDDKPRDLIAVLQRPVDGSRVVVLRPTAHQDLVSALRKALDSSSSQAS